MTNSAGQLACKEPPPPNAEGVPQASVAGHHANQLCACSCMRAHLPHALIHSPSRAPTWALASLELVIGALTRSTDPQP